MVKLKVSYEKDEELIALKKVLRGKVEKMKISKNNEGQYKKAYIFLKQVK